MPRLKRHGVAHKSTGGMLTPIPAPVDPVGNAVTSNTVPPLRSQTRSGRDDR